MSEAFKICIQRAETRQKWDAMQDDYINRAIAAADRIEKLEAALREIAEANSVQAGLDKDMYRRWRYVATNAIDIARKALEDSQ